MKTFKAYDDSWVCSHEQMATSSDYGYTVTQCVRSQIWTCINDAVSFVLGTKVSYIHEKTNNCMDFMVPIPITTGCSIHNCKSRVVRSQPFFFTVVRAHAIVHRMRSVGELISSRDAYCGLPQSGSFRGFVLCGKVMMEFSAIRRNLHQSSS